MQDMSLKQLEEARDQLQQKQNRTPQEQDQLQSLRRKIFECHALGHRFASGCI